MKKLYLSLVTFLLSLTLFAQENNLILSGGYSFAKIEDSDLTTPGWRINGLYEFNPAGGPWAFGLSIGYIGLNGTTDVAGAGSLEYTIGTVPIYFAPKFMFGSDKVKGFIKGAIGSQNSHLQRAGLLEIEDSDWGFYGGGSAGVNIYLGQMFYISAEYELAWLTNTSYKDGLVNSAMGGIGFKF